MGSLREQFERVCFVCTVVCGYLWPKCHIAVSWRSQDVTALWQPRSLRWELTVNCMKAMRWLQRIQGGHKPGKPGILRDFSEHGKLREFCATSGKNCNKRSILVRHSNICKTAVDWIKRSLGCQGVTTLPLMKVIITFTFCCDNLWKSKFMAVEKPGKLGEFFSPTLWPPWKFFCCGVDGGVTVGNIVTGDWWLSAVNVLMLHHYPGSKLHFSSYRA